MSSPKPLRTRMISQTLESRKSLVSQYRLVELTAFLIILGLGLGGLLTGKELLERSRINSQITQLAEYDEAVANFYEKYDGLPGDLLYVSAQRHGLIYGDGTPGHGDGDGKISPCSLGWQWNLGCETALFWSQLGASGLISENFSADGRLGDGRLQTVGLMDPYLPRSPLGDGIYIAVWNTDAAQESPGQPIPYGNYYEISRISGIRRGRMNDDSAALTPVQAHAIDSKIDDGAPLTGRVVVNGDADWPRDAWGSYATPGDYSCVSEDHTYNIYNPARMHHRLCHLAVAFTCCKPKDDD